MATVGVSGSAEASTYCWASPASSTLKKGTCYSYVFPLVKLSNYPSYPKHFLGGNKLCWERPLPHLQDRFGVNVNA